MAFQSLGQFTINSGSLSVVLSDNANGYVIADAMLVQVTGPSLVTNAQGGYSESGTGWNSFTDPKAYDDNERYVAAGTGATGNLAGYRSDARHLRRADVLDGLRQSSHHCDLPSVRWHELAGIRHGQSTIVPGVWSDAAGAQPFQSLGQFTINSGTLRVVLSDNANGYVVANAMFVQAYTGRK